MNKLGTLYDSVAKRHYTLYVMKYPEVKRLVKEGMTSSVEEVIRFDSESEYFRPDYRLDMVEKQKSGERILHAKLGLEQMPFILSQDSATKNFKLLDGFNRLFGSFGEFEQEVLVKVYEDITVKDWVNILMHANAWKVKGLERALLRKSFVLDRGFKFSFFEHFDIDLSFSPNGDTDNLIEFDEAFTTYVSQHHFDTMLDNERFLEDVQLMINILSHELVFEKESKKKKETICSENSNFSRDKQSFELLKQTYVKVLGAMRRKELRDGLTLSDFTFDDYLAFFNRKDLQAHFVKVSLMKVPGRAENYVDTHLKEAFRSYFLEKSGHAFSLKMNK